MPVLKQIDCSIELGPGNIKLKEHGARYSDGHVETFVAVPDNNVPFSIHLRSEGYIAPGLAFFVFMDGEYQCNRNRIDLKLPGEGVAPSTYETEFRVQQKEDKTSVGTFVVRDWSFAKLNRVAADKAPSLNPQFTNNVGTIEIIVLRCKSNIEDPPPQASRKKTSKHEKSAAPRKAIAAAPAPSAKSAAAPESALGGLFGLFDGAYDTYHLGDDVSSRRVLPTGRIRPRSPPGMTWDPSKGNFVPKKLQFSRVPADAERYQDSAMMSRINAVGGKAIGGKAQLDGHGSQPGVKTNQWGDRGRDDMRGDKYLGLQGEARSLYKQILRENGASVSAPTEPPKNHPRYENYPQYDNYPRSDKRQGYAQAYQAPPRIPRYEKQTLQNPQHGTKPPLHIVLRPNPQTIADALERMRQKVQAFMRKHPERDHEERARELAMLTNLQNLQQQGHGTLDHFPHWLLEILTDMEVRRLFALRLKQEYPDLDFSQLMDKLDSERMEVLRDPLFHREYRIDKLDECLPLYFMLYERVEALNDFIKKATEFGKVSTDDLLARADYVCMQRDKVNEIVDELEGQAEERRGAEQTKGPAPKDLRAPEREPSYPTYPDAACPQAANGNGDGAPAYQQGWQQVGTGSWNGGKSWRQYPAPPMQAPELEQAHASPAWKAGPGGNVWGLKAANYGDAEPQNHWAGEQKSQGGIASMWGQNQNNDHNDWEKPGSDKTREHDLSRHNDQNGRGWEGCKSRNSTHASKKNDAWVNGDQNQQQAKNDANWGAQSANQQTFDAGWGGDEQQDTKAKSVRSNTSTARLTNEDPNAYIKPYWKDWNKPFGRRDSSDANTKKKRDDPREVYNYPASPLPAVTGDVVKHASHGIQMSRGADYSHKCRRPTYIDTMEHPYAVFSFKYRSKEALEKILKRKIDEVDLKRIQAEVEKDRLMTMPKHKLIEQLMEKRSSSKSETKPGPNSGFVADCRGGQSANKPVSNGWPSAGGGNDAENAAQNNDNGGQNEWENQNKQSSRSHRSGSKHNGRQSNRSNKQNNGSWKDKASHTSAKQDNQNTWDNSLAGAGAVPWQW